MTVNDYRTTMECLLQILPKVAIPLLVFIIHKLKGTQMGLKYCDKCEVAVDQAVLECPDCGHKKFVPGTVIWKRDTPKPSVPKVTTTSTPQLAAKPIATRVCKECCPRAYISSTLNASRARVMVRFPSDAVVRAQGW